MLLFYVLSYFKKGDTIQGGTLYKGGHYLRKYSSSKSTGKKTGKTHLYAMSSYASQQFEFKRRWKRNENYEGFVSFMHT